MRIYGLIFLLLMSGCMSSKEKDRGGNFLLSIDPRQLAIPANQEAVLNTYVQFFPTDTASHITATRVSLKLKQDYGLVASFEPAELNLSNLFKGVLRIKPSPTTPENTYILVVEGTDEYGKVREAEPPLFLTIGKQKTLGGNFSVYVSPGQVDISAGQEVLFNIQVQLEPVDASTHVSSSKISLRHSGEPGVFTGIFEPAELNSANSFKGVLRVKASSSIPKKNFPLYIEAEDEFRKTKASEPVFLTVK